MVTALLLIADALNNIARAIIKEEESEKSILLGVIVLMIALMLDITLFTAIMRNLH